MKNVYFVRHGETAANIENQYSPDDTPLNKRGLIQARTLADRFSRIDVDLIISSGLTRARQTAGAIGKKTGQKVVLSELFREKRFPSKFLGKTPEDPEVAKIRADIAEHYGDKDWHHSDEENYFDMQDRAVKALAFISERSENDVVVVTHGTYLRMLVLRMMFGNLVPNSYFGSFFNFVLTRNTGITRCMLDDEGKWKMITWNDHAHLG